jgi:hypothetical protein
MLRLRTSFAAQQNTPLFVILSEAKNPIKADISEPVSLDHDLSKHIPTPM